MGQEQQAFSMYSSIAEGLKSIRAQILRGVGTLDEVDLDESREESVVSRLMDLAPKRVEVQFTERFAKKEETPDTRSAHGPHVRVVYYIPASGDLDVLKYLPSGVKPGSSVRATYSGTIASSDRKAYPTYTGGHVMYDLSADMNPAEHKEQAAAIASDIESLVRMINEEIGAFRPSLDEAIREALRERRERSARTSATLDDLDVPLRD